MEQYCAFLRGINVSGQRLVKMEALRQAFTAEGFSGVKTYIQSGNMIFNSERTDTELLIAEMENLIEKHFGFRTDVILRRLADIESLLNSLQSVVPQYGRDQKYYITCLKKEYSEKITLPLFSKNQDVEIVFNTTSNLISISHLYKGNWGFPNAFVEKFIGIPATTRNPVTLSKIVELR